MSSDLPTAEVARRPLTSGTSGSGGSFLTDVPGNENLAETVPIVPHRLSKLSNSASQPSDMRRVSRTTIFTGPPALPPPPPPVSGKKAKLLPLTSDTPRLPSAAAAAETGPVASGEASSSLFADAPPPDAPRAPTLWAKRPAGGGGLRAGLLKAREREQQEEKLKALEVHTAARVAAKEAHRAGRFKDAIEALDQSIAVNARCDALHRTRSGCLYKTGQHERALEDARRAARLNPLGSSNFYWLGRCLQQRQNMTDAGASYLSAMRLGSPSLPVGVNESAAARAARYTHGVESAGVESRYACLLDTVRRQREYARIERPADDRLLESGARSGRGQRSSIFDPRKKLEEAFELKRAEEPEAPEPKVGRVGGGSADVSWEEPYDGGEEIYLYVLQLSAYDVKWQPEDDDFFDGFRPWKTAHEGPAKVTSFQLGKLKPGNAYKLRMMCKNSVGDSPWSAEVRFETSKDAAGQKKEDEVVPKSWLRIQVPDVMTEHIELVGGDPAAFVHELGAALLPNVHEVRRIFKMYAAMGVGAKAGTELSPIQFSKFARDVGIIDGKSRATGKPNGFKPIASGEIDLLFQRVNATNLQSRRASWRKAQALNDAAAKAIDAVAEEIAKGAGAGDADLEKDADDGSSGADGMALKEFVAALARLAWSGYPKSRSGLGERLTTLLEQLVYPSLADALDQADPMAGQLEMPRCKAVLSFWDKDMKAIFASYAAADMDVDAQDATDSINLAELMFMMNEGKLIDVNLSVSRVSAIFTHVNTQSEEEEGGDEDESELDYNEFMQVVVRCCDAKIPEANRGGEPFEKVLQSWLQLVFVPTYRRLLKDKARGIGSKTL